MQITGNFANFKLNMAASGKFGGKKSENKTPSIQSSQRIIDFKQSNRFYTIILMIWS